MPTLAPRLSSTASYRSLLRDDTIKRFTFVRKLNSLSLVLCFLGCQESAEPVTSDAGAATVTNSADVLQKEVSLLELRKDDIFLDTDGSKTLRREAAERINGAFGRLVGHGKSAWPVLFANLDNTSPSTATAATVGPHTVGEKCYYVLRNQITSLVDQVGGIEKAQQLLAVLKKLQ